MIVPSQMRSHRHARECTMSDTPRKDQKSARVQEQVEESMVADLQNRSVSEQDAQSVKGGTVSQKGREGK